MSDWGVGFATGIVIGLTIGIAAGRRRKPWSELSDKEKRIMAAIVAGLALLVVAGVVVFFLV